MISNHGSVAGLFGRIWVASDGAPSAFATLCASLLSAILVLRSAPDPSDLALLWPANAVVIGFILAGKPSLLWSRLIGGVGGAALANYVSGATAVTSLQFSAGNLAEIGVALTLLRANGGFSLATVPALLRFIAICCGVAPATGALIGIAALGTTNGAAFQIVFLNWYVSCALGAIVIIPLVVLPLRATAPGSPRQRWNLVQGGMALIAVVGASFAAFYATHLPLLFLPMAVMIVITVRFGWRGASLALLAITVCAAQSTATGQGPIASLVNAEFRTLFLQFYLAIMYMTALTVASLLQERDARERDLLFAESRYRLISEHSSDALLHIDREGVCLYASPSSIDLIGLAPETLVGTPLGSLVNPADRADVTATHLSVLARPGSTGQCKYRVIDSAGRERWLETRTRGVFTAAGKATGAVSVIRDVTDVVATHAKLEHVASTDALTGIANRGAFIDALEAAMVRSAPGRLAIAMLDIDHFKAINDAYGHAWGDLVLQKVAQIFKGACREDAMAARIGGEEFALMLPGVDIESAMAIGDRIRRRVSNLQVEIDEQRIIRVTVSIGVAMHGHGLTAEGLLAAADVQLYQSKRGGRNRLSVAA